MRRSIVRPAVELIATQAAKGKTGRYVKSYVMLSQRHQDLPNIITSLSSSTRQGKGPRSSISHMSTERQPSMMMLLPHRLILVRMVT